MTDIIVSFRVDKKLHERMKKHTEINWSAVLRRAVEENTREFDRSLAEKAARDMDLMKKASRGKSSLELIHEWRNRRL